MNPASATPDPARSQRTREIAREVLIEAFGASATPFVPIPFVDDMLLTRVLRRIARKVLDRHGLESSELAKRIVDAYVEAGAPSAGASIVTGAVRFVVRKVAVVMDVKKSHDVFGESIALALAVDVAAENRIADVRTAARLGGAIHRALQRVGSGPLEGLVRAGRDAFARSSGKTGAETTGEGSPAGSTRAGQLAEAIGAEVDKAREQIESALRWEWQVHPT